MEGVDPGREGAGSGIWYPGGSLEEPVGSRNFCWVGTQLMVLSRESGTLGVLTSLPGWPCQGAGKGAEGFMAGKVSGQIAGPCGVGAGKEML